MAGYGRYQVHYLLSDETKIGAGPHRDLPRVGDHIVMNSQVATNSSYVDVEYVITKAVWVVKNPTTLVKFYVAPSTT